MMRGLSKSINVLIVLLLFSNLLYAGTTGKIVGKVVDKETGEPLFGANIVVVGTTMGAAVDIEGDYVILNVPPGVHTLKVSMIGYNSVTIKDVRVRIDETTTVNAELSSTSYQIEDVTVVANRTVVKKDVSTSVTAVQGRELENLPVTSITEVVGLQAGVEDGLVVRGGESNELLFNVDGVTLRDPRNNQPISSVALTSIQEVSIERGGFNAEYGQVRSGIVNIVTKEGKPNEYHFAAQVKYSPATKKHFGISVYDPNSMWNRPYTDPDVAFTGTQSGAWDYYTQRQYPQFEGWNAISERLLSDDDPTNDLTPLGAQKVWEWERRRQPSIEPDYNFDVSFGGPVPVIGKSLGDLRFFSSFRFEKEMLLIPLSRDDYQEYSGSIKLNSDISKDMKLMITGSFGKTFNVAMNTDDRQFNNPQWGINGVSFWNPTDYLRTPFQIAEITNEQRAGRIFTDSWYSEAEVEHFALSSKLTHFISPTTFFEVSLEHVQRDFLTGPIRRRNLSEIYEVIPGYFVDEAPFGFDPNPLTGITGMFYGGHTSTMRDSTQTASYTLKADISSQINKEHLIKAGVSFSYYDLDLDYGSVNEFFSSVNYVKQNWKPYQFSAYVQDKIEMLGFVANVGLRLDVSNPNTQWYDVDVFDEDFFSSNYDETKDYAMKDADIDIALSPRLGISHPITENSKLFFNYGHFKQMPAYEEIFRIGRSLAGEMQNFGNPNLEQARTVSYELGYDHSLFDEYLIQVAAFYNDITNQLAYTQYISDRLGIGYFLANNNSYEDIRGLELSFKRTRGDWVRGFINFTYQVNSRGAFGKPIINQEPSEQKLIDQNTTLLYQQKPVPQPRANMSLTFLSPTHLESDLTLNQLLNNWSLNLLAEWRAGEYITYNPKGITGIVNNVQTTDYFNVDLRLNKKFVFDAITVMLYVESRNLLNLKRLSGESFYDVHDQRFYLESLHLPKSEAYDNIVGDDRIGEYRKHGVEFQPIEQVGTIDDVSSPIDRVIYYDRSNNKYMNYSDGQWSEVEKSKMDKILEDKAYIDMPNNSSFDFLNPRQLFFGLNVIVNF